MTKKKIISFALVLAMLIGIFAVIPSVGAVSSTPVKLIYAKPGYTSSPYVFAKGYVEVENIDYTKRVTIHYSYDGITWGDSSATYLKQSHGNFEIWSFETPATIAAYKQSAYVTFAIKYEVDTNGTTYTYWDNNNGQNYKIVGGLDVISQFDIGNGGVANYYCYRLGNNKFEGAVQLKNIAYQKTVKVVYTSDNWQTTKETYATYGYNFHDNNNIELWNYSFNDTADEITYKIEYTVNGTTYVDDNFGNYYTI